MGSQLHTSLPWCTLVQMTRPGFLVITAVACVLGISVAALCGHGIHMWTTLAALVLAVLIHAAANVINDYHDALSGANDTNTQGLFPFTGGARLIQDGHVSVRDTYDSAKALLAHAWLVGGHSPRAYALGFGVNALVGLDFCAFAQKCRLT
jgi:1,4-dihydroxy-2-naphthoate octaprenyltransferase